jgi:predicted tellurium resistance membrane protein TerC
MLAEDKDYCLAYERLVSFHLPKVDHVFEDIFTLQSIIGLVALTAMEIVLGIDNIVFIAILAGRLPVELRKKAQRNGLLLALISRIGLLFTLSWVLGLTKPIFSFTDLGIPADALKTWLSTEVNEVSVRDLILLIGGLFLVAKSVREIHHKMEGPSDKEALPKPVSYAGVLAQIAVLDIIFSLDSVITAVGMVKNIPVMIIAVMLAVGVMLIFANTVSTFVEKHPTLKMLALSFLILIGVMLIAEGVGTHINKGYIYFAMSFALIVEFLNLRIRAKTPALPPAANVGKDI